MKYNYLLVLTIIVCVFVSYFNVQKFKASASSDDLTRAINERINKSQNDNSALADGENNSSASGRNSREIAKMLDDNSVIKTIYDSVGNKKESRCFENHRRVMCVVMRSMVNGQRFIQVYGQNGYVKELDGSMLEKVATATADEIADLADIYVDSGQTVQPVRIEKTPAPLPTPLVMSGQNQTSTQNIPTEQVKPEDAKKSEPTTADSEIKSAPATKNTQPKENEKPPVSNRQLEEK